MLTDFLSHPNLQSLTQITMSHRDADALWEPTAAVGPPLRKGDLWTITADHSYFTGMVTDFSFSSSDPAPIAAAIQATVQSAVIDHQDAMFRVLSSINTEVINSLDGAEIVRNVLHEVKHVFSACDAGVLRLYDEESGYLLPVAHEGLPEEYRQYRLLPNESISGEVFSTLAPALLNGRSDIVAAHKVMRPESQSFMERSDIANALMCVPVVAEGKCLGTLTTLCFSPLGRFAPFDLTVLQSLAAQIAIGYRRSQSYQEALATSRHLEEAQEALVRKNCDLDRAVSLHESLLRIFASEADLTAQLDAVSTLFRVEFRFESVLGLAHRTIGWLDAYESEALSQTVEAAELTVGHFLVHSDGDAGVLRALFGTVAAFVALDFMRNMSQFELINARKCAWFDELARNTDVRRSQFGFHLHRYVQVIAAGLPDDSSSYGAYRVLSELQSVLPTALAFHRNGGVVVLISASTVAALERSAAAAARLAAGSRLRMGASAPRDKLGDLEDALHEATQAARAQDRRAISGLFRHRDMGVERILTGRTRQEVLEFSRQILAPLDDPRHSQLHLTLACYVAEGKSTSRAAGRLGIHANTLYQRLQRIETLLKRSLSDPNDYTLISLACQLESDYTKGEQIK